MCRDTAWCWTSTCYFLVTWQTVSAALLQPTPTILEFHVIIHLGLGVLWSGFPRGETRAVRFLLFRSLCIVSSYRIRHQGLNSTSGLTLLCAKHSKLHIHLPPVQKCTYSACVQPKQVQWTGCQIWRVSLVLSLLLLLATAPRLTIIYLAHSALVTSYSHSLLQF